MNQGRVGVVVACALLATACDAAGSWWWQLHHAGGTTHEDAGTHEPLLNGLPPSEAPAPSARFASWTLFWGTLDVTAPGFAGPPRDELTLALDADNLPRYLSWNTLPSFTKTFGDAADEFPLSGTKRVTPSNSSAVFEATVLDAAPATSDHFLLRTQLVSEDGLSNYVEQVEGWANAGGWDVHYTEQGAYFGASLDAEGVGFVATGDQGTPISNVWSAPVEVVSPGFPGAPIDHMTVSLADTGQLRSFGFERFVRPNVTFGFGPDDLPVSGSVIRGDLTVTVDPAVAPNDGHFVLRYHVAQPSRLNDFVEGIEGTRVGDTREVRYFISGTLFGASIEAHASGTLLPAAAP
jgi:hypothetical protein